MEAEDVTDRKQFLAFLAALRRELADGGENWESVTLEDFLEAMEAWATDWPRDFAENPWTHAAHLLHAASIYE